MAKRPWTTWRTHLMNLSELDEITTKEYAQLFGFDKNAVQVAFLKLRKIKVVDARKEIFYIKRKFGSTPNFYYVYKLNDKGWRSVEHFKNKQKAILNKTIPLQNQTT